MAEILIAYGDEHPESHLALEEALGILSDSPVLQASEERHGAPYLLQSVLDQFEDEKKRRNLHG